MQMVPSFRKQVPAWLLLPWRQILAILALEPVTHPPVSFHAHCSAPRLVASYFTEREHSILKGLRGSCRPTHNASSLITLRPISLKHRPSTTPLPASETQQGLQQLTLTSCMVCKALPRDQFRAVSSGPLPVSPIRHIRRVAGSLPCSAHLPACVPRTHLLHQLTFVPCGKPCFHGSQSLTVTTCPWSPVLTKFVQPAQPHHPFGLSWCSHMVYVYILPPPSPKLYFSPGIVIKTFP